MRKKRAYFKTSRGQIIWEDSRSALREIEDRTVDLIITSPPFGLLRGKEYGNVHADKYIDWFMDFAVHFKRILKRNGSFVLDIGGSWVKGQPTRSIYQFELLVVLCRELGFHLAQDFYWWNPAKLPTPAEWVTVRRVRVKDAVNQVWWLSKSPWPKASNTRVLQPYSSSMRTLLKKGYKPSMRPSGHDISSQFNSDNGAAIPPNLIASANTESNSSYISYCKDKGIKPHPARFPKDIPEYFVRMLTDEGDMVVDPFAGSCVTGEVCERLGRRWKCIEIEEAYLQGALGRFKAHSKKKKTSGSKDRQEVVYQIPKVGGLWRDDTKSKKLTTGKSRR